MLKKRSFLLILLLFPLLLPIRTKAWNGTGHMVIAAIAYRQLPDEKRNLFIELLKSHPDYDTWMAEKPQTLPDNDLSLYLFMRASTWPDVIRGDLQYHRPRWHFIDVPLYSTRPNLNTLPQDSENILSRIEQSERLLSDRSKSSEERAIHLSWLIHLIGDIHQPLHCATRFSPNYPEGDRGGNMVFVNVADESGPRNLHAIWDRLLGGTFDDEGDVVIAVNTISSIPNLSVDDLTGTTPKEWLRQSVLIAFDTAYVSGTMPFGNRENPVSLPVGYIDTAKTVANKRAALAGFRLAGTLKDLKAQPTGPNSEAGVPNDAKPTPANPPDASLLDQLLGTIKEQSALIAAMAFAVLLMIVLSTKLISILLKLDLWGLKQIAPAFYLFAPFGRWKLYRRYRERLRTGTGLSEDLKHGVEHYIDLPFTSSRAVAPNVKLSDVFTTLRPDQRVIIEAEGGRGKSTLCYYLARRCVERRDLFGGKLLEPVIVDGLTYTGNMLQAITGALSKGAYVNQAIVESQLAAGNLLIILEGFSEIREAHLAAASSTELPNFIQQLPNTPFIITSRTSLPPDLVTALSDPLTIRLADVDATTERLFFSHYLKHGEQEVDSLIKQIKERFSDLSRIPLMLKLVAAVYDEEGQVPKNTAALFDKYTRQLLREEVTGIKYINGLFFAINHLVSETYLRKGGDRGFTENQGVELLRKIKDDLEARNIKLSPIDLLEVLKRAGLYKQVGRHLRFFHDSFESYFGARALESDFSDGKYELLLQCSDNKRLEETRRFLKQIFDAPEDKQQLQMVLQKKAEHPAQATPQIVERRTAPEVKQISIDRQQYAATEEHHIHILHLSDLHFGADTFGSVYRTQLETDLIQELDIRRLDYLVISGDIANRSTEKEYDAAFAMLNDLVKRFGLNAGRVVVVPGNHDLNWDLSEQAYPFVSRRMLPSPLPADRCIPAGDAGALLRDDALYSERFANFNTHFYRRVYSGQDYPTDYAEQALMIERVEDRILFLGLNSSWQLDHHFRTRSGIHMPALARVLDRLQDGKYDGWLKIAVWHHPVTGREMMNDEFMQLLAVHGFQICLHGHIHEAVQGFHYYDDQRGMHIIGAGTFGAPANEQVTGIPLQYNLLTFDPKTGEMTVSTRRKEKPEGAWSADARWGTKNDPKPWYRFTVPNYRLEG